ncbi:MAG: hypothetical protein ACREJN_21515 [Nitrospiraceae bacterium]
MTCNCFDCTADRENREGGWDAARHENLCPRCQSRLMVTYDNGCITERCLNVDCHYSTKGQDGGAKVGER